MKWIILYREDLEKSAVSTQEMLKIHDIEATILPIQKVTNLEDENINSLVKNATHCVLLDNALLLEDSAAFFYGYLVGRVKHFYSLTNEWSKNMEFFSNVYLFSGEDAMLKSLKKQMPNIKEEEKTRDAFSNLFNDGIPYTADCFALYITKGKLDICQRFIDAGISINCRTEDGTPMLNVAIRAEQEECVNWILQQKVDIDAVSNDRGYSAVMDAVWKNNLELTKVLIDRGANLNFISRDGQSVLVLAVGAGNYDICKLLAESGADPDVKDQMGMSALEYANLFGKKDIAKVLQKYHKA
ncbi:MAG: ankyrin repeat domain-containing protein [Treponema sp.]|nr:ankyrin repeat domain-containing protein [Candidatus Treponema scatequi]